MFRTTRNGTTIPAQKRPKLHVTIEKLQAAAPAKAKGTFSRQEIGKKVRKASSALRDAGVDTLFTYPATRLARLPWQKLALKFTDECVLVGLGLILIACNLLVSPRKDTSLFANALSKHATKNPKLYAKLFSTTYTASADGLIPEAQADEQLVQPQSSVGRVAGATIANSTVTTIDEEGMSAAIPDSPKLFLNNQIRVYETQTGDTLESIAKKHDIDTNTIRWSNNLQTDNIKPGWFLVIPSVKGVLVQADNDTTIAGIARKFKCSEEKIISYNGLDGADSVEPGQYIMCPDGSIVAPPKPATPSKTRNVGVSYAAIPDLPGTTNWFVKGNCTWYVAKRFKVTFHGNAKDWLRNAQNAGYKTGKVPMAGVPVVTSTTGRYGHVAYVESVNANGTINISEMNFEGLGKKSFRTIDGDSVAGYIYPKE